jgi:hypothetical protein
MQATWVGTSRGEDLHQQEHNDSTSTGEPAMLLASSGQMVSLPSCTAWLSSCLVAYAMDGIAKTPERGQTWRQQAGKLAIDWDPQSEQACRAASCAFPPSATSGCCFGCQCPQLRDPRLWESSDFHAITCSGQNIISSMIGSNEGSKVVQPWVSAGQQRARQDALNVWAIQLASLQDEEVASIISCMTMSLCRPDHFWLPFKPCWGLSPKCMCPSHT